MIHDGIKSEIFFTKLNKVLRPTGPVATLKLLFGRERQIDDLEHALYATGRHAFIYGDRGGKSSLAQTVAGKLQEGKECILVGCETTSTLQSVISDIMLNALPKDKQSGHEHRWNIGVQLGGYGANIARTHKNSSQHTDISTVSSAVHALRTLEKKHSKRPFIVIDEFDQIGSQEERAQFGALVKQLGDRASEVKLIFTGIGESLMSLIGDINRVSVNYTKLNLRIYPGTADLLSLITPFQSLM
ncbi:hypothetical protein CCS41_02805 [Candidatus Fukatsuia symbiotica]|uniref:Orc1-like AAA ATPase domain-containing protein n=2 Tax=Candidatus Fukatsuia symbiotica TaxID=1878942 RepID=A0A2U8I3F5_9GAMM|nr:hypothetical protein CCS41_02805 [Candidatus Fukatsuia symbiotica]